MELQANDEVVIVVPIEKPRIEGGGYLSKSGQFKIKTEEANEER